MRRFALCIPAGSDGTRVLPPCSDRRWQIAGTAGQPYLVFRSLALLLRHGPATGRAATEPQNGGAARRSLRSGYGSAERWDEIPGLAGCGNEGSSFTNRGSCHRGVGLHHGTWGLIRWMIGCSTIAFTPTPMGQVLLLGSHARRDAGAVCADLGHGDLHSTEFLGNSKEPCRCLTSQPAT